MKSFKYVLGYLLLIQLTMPYLIPLDMVFRDRMDYSLVKDNLYSIDVILDQIDLQIKREKLTDYIIILGDSIAYSGPGNAKQSIGFYMQQLARESSPAHPCQIFNLSLPAMQTGDIYTMLLKLDQHHISTDNVIINVNYSGFVDREPSPPSVFWLKNDLKYLDKDSFNRVLANLKANNYKDQKDLEFKVHQMVLDNVEMDRYSAFIKKALYSRLRELIGASPLDDALGDARPWFEKEGLRQILQQPEYLPGFSSKAFDMSINNPQIYFLDKIIAHQQKKHTLIFLAAANETLMRDEVMAPGYIRNLQQIDHYFQMQEVTYLNLQGKIDSNLFSDHLHLTAGGYQGLAQLLWNNFEGGAKS
ncbi:MAG: hypothetical protein CVU90_07265 [Firmicutes bacterium HGW-Firmicutes-15]|nr:MAG: hypothetical protein CVU90_07265 [Firmicutes bacterium HGW-Firmicutes-15]